MITAGYPRVNESVIKDEIKFVKTKRRYEYCIYLNNLEIGLINYIIKDNIMILSNLYIDSNFQGEGYGYKVIDYIINTLKIKSIIGESVKNSVGFWRKCISKFNGIEIEETLFDNCPFSFMIPKINISNEKLKDYIKLTSEIL